MSSYIVYKDKCGDVCISGKRFNIFALLFSSVWLLWIGAYTWGVAVAGIQLCCYLLSLCNVVSASGFFLMMLCIGIFVSLQSSHFIEMMLRKSGYRVERVIFADSYQGAMFVYSELIRGNRKKCNKRKGPEARSNRASANK